MTLIMSFCDLGNKYVTFLALGWYRLSRNTVSLSANNFIKARKLPGFFSELTSSLSPRNGYLCFTKERMEHTIPCRICLFSAIWACRVWCSHYIYSRGWIFNSGLQNISWLHSFRMVHRFRVVAQHITELHPVGKGLLTGKPLSLQLPSERRRAQGPQNTPSSLGQYCSHECFSSQLMLNFQLHPWENVLGRILGDCTWWYKNEYFSALESSPAERQVCWV